MLLVLFSEHCECFVQPAADWCGSMFFVVVDDACLWLARRISLSTCISYSSDICVSYSCPRILLTLCSLLWWSTVKTTSFTVRYFWFYLYLL